MTDGLDLAGLEINHTIERQKRGASAKSRFAADSRFLDSNQIKLDITYIINPVDGKEFISRDELEKISPLVIDKHRQLHEGKGDCLDNGVPMLGWLTLPAEISNQNLDEIIEKAQQFREKIDAFVSIGIGGSYLGIEAAFKALTHTWFNQLNRADRGDIPEIYFLGQNLDADYFRDTLDMLQGKRIGINVISKSGTTTETTIAFRILRNLIENWAGGDSSEFIIATTDKTRGALKTLAAKKGYKTFIVPDNIGGRFSVLTDVGLLGLAVAGMDISEFVAGFRHMKTRLAKADFWTNPAMVHAAVRHLAFLRGKRVEVVATNSTHLYHLVRWMEQLFPESEGHKGHGLWVSPSLYSEKLHANGQMVQDGPRDILETFIRLENQDNVLPIPPDPENLDGLNFLSDRRCTMNFVNGLVIDGPAYAHFCGGVPNMTLDIPRRNAFNIGQFYYLMEMSVAISGYLAGHNPFIQPGVEAYKKAMFALAGKPGTDSQRREMEESIRKFDRVVI